MNAGKIIRDTLVLIGLLADILDEDLMNCSRSVSIGYTLLKW